MSFFAIFWATYLPIALIALFPIVNLVGRRFFKLAGQIGPNALLNASSRAF